MTAQTENMEFQAEVRELLQIMIHSLYSEREIFLRELISNASDALDKLRSLALTRAELLEGDERLHIRIERDPDQRVIRVVDNGVGMSRDEVVENIGTIARSGTRQFLEQLKEGQAETGELPRLIGQFGVGFYSSFMVADEVVLETRRAGESGGTRWSSQGTGSYSIEAVDRPERGTTVTLHLKEPGEGDAAADFTDEWVIRQIVKRYSDFVEYPIEMEVEREEGEDDEREKVVKTETLNSMKPLWTRPKEEVEEAEYAEFYKHLSHDWEEPLETIHFRGEGTHSYTALLYLPRQRSFDLFDPGANKSHVALYVKRVHIMSECEELMPPWLRFVRGLVDSDDLPLNISRETLQHSRQVGQIQKRLVKKVLDTLEKRLAQDRESYRAFWSAFGPVLKEGLYHLDAGDETTREALARVCLWNSTAGEEPCTLPEYVERMPMAQKAVWYLSGPDAKSLAASPHLEAYRAKEQEVLLLSDTIDEFAVERLREFQGKPLKSVERGEAELESEEEKEAREKRQEEQKPLLEAVQEQLDEHVSEVRFSSRLKDSPVVLVSNEFGPSRVQERMMRELGQAAPPSKRVLELNPAHPVVERMAALSGEEGDEERFGEYCELLYGQALLAEGSPLPDPARFSRLVSALMTG